MYVRYVRLGLPAATNSQFDFAGASLLITRHGFV